jgi:hypothetical protein
MNPRVPSQHLELEPRASDFLELLRDLGHLDDAGIEGLTGALVSKAHDGHVVTFEEVRRAAAVKLFETEGTMRSEARELLGAEWPRLFF